LRHRYWKLACAAALAWFGTVAAAAQPAPVAPETLAEFARPHDLIDIGGRRLNLFCMGQGKVTVLFDAGGSDWSVIWALVQPKLAAKARVCSYDRAGLGYSDPGFGPRAPSAIVEDLHALIHAAKLDTPLILVGHSLGGFNVKLYAALYPEDVAGLLLVDPSEERSSDRVRDRLRARYGTSLAARLELAGNDGIAFLLDRYQACATASEKGDLDPASLTYRRCSDPVRAPLGPVIAAERQRIQVRPAYQQAQASEILNSVYGRSWNDALYQRLFRPGMFGAMPMLVLSHGNFDAADPMDAADFQSNLWLHADSAALSRKGRHRIVPGTGHNIEIDDPDAIVAAVIELLTALGGR
jgi:pimeloyl-ACP methyl ester carboxylesterase